MTRSQSAALPDDAVGAAPAPGLAGAGGGLSAGGRGGRFDGADLVRERLLVFVSSGEDINRSLKGLEYRP